MRRLILLNLLLLLFLKTFSQYNSRPGRSRFYNSKISTFTVAADDILLYTVKKDNVQYDLAVTIKKYANTISFDYSIPSRNTTGSIFMQSAAVKNAIAYDTILTGNTKIFKDTSIFWLSAKNYTDLASAKETIMDVGSGKETFKRQRVSTVKLNYKGKEKIVTVFDIENTNLKAKKRLLVLSDEDNPLIIQTDFGWTTTLKEVR